MKTLKERFWAKVDKKICYPCWMWTGYVNKKGYGQIGIGRRNDGLLLAHRASWLIHHGKLTDKLICHTCDIPACVNPKHLFEGTYAANTADMLKKGRHRCVAHSGERNGNSKLTQQDVEYVKVEVAKGKSRRSVAVMLGVAHSTVNRLINGDTWK